jgi:outer membrane protein TolC
MNKAILFVVMAGCAALVQAQDGVERVVAQVEKNNTTLQALAQHVKADKLGARVGVFPENPELGFGFLKGRPASLGRRRDFSVTQLLDFPLAYFQKQRLAGERGRQLDWEWQKRRRELLLETRLLCLDLVHANALQKELAKRLAAAREMALAVETRFARGEANILELNKAKLHRLTCQEEVEHNDIRRRGLLDDLARLNGGQAGELADSAFPVARVPEEFAAWFAQAEQGDPQLQWLKSEVRRLELQTRLDRSLGLPKLAVGYMSETTAGERFQGVTLGVSVPLFEKANVIRQDKARVAALRLVEADERLQFYQQMKSLHARTVALQQAVDEFRSGLAELDSTPLLRKALEKGEISLIEYVLELSLYYASAEHLLQEELNLARALAVLNQYGSQGASADDH